MRSVAADLPKIATTQIALSISDCMGLHLASLMQNVFRLPFQEALASVYSLPDIFLFDLDCPGYIPLAIHNIAEVGVLVGGVDFLALQGHVHGQLPAYSHYSALGGIHSHFPSVRPFCYGVQCGLQIDL
ncbi:hypothetical protein AYI70_g10755 [Smittium culicis]|uniref:Uncharacterized protein n=1 Tax=Smittium culicis TaxID=133412 RepID=A0A1R1X522_9FUNG|nr:hypothetical protein AYI70_g10755 [Smittium culicis]